MSAVLPITADPRFRITTATAGQTEFSVPFPFQANADIAVLRIDRDTGDSQELVEGEGYNLTGANNPAGGTVTLLTVAREDDIYVRLGRAQLSRVASIVRAGKFRSRSIDDDIDRFLIIALELQRDLDRAVKVELGETAAAIGAAGAGKVLRFDDHGNVVAGPTAADIENAQTYAAAAATSAATALATANKLEFSTVAAGLADTGMDYSGGAPTVLVGQRLTMGGFPYEVASVIETGVAIVLTAGGVHLRVLPFAGYYHADALGCGGDASIFNLSTFTNATDDTELLQQWMDLCGSTNVPGWLTAGKQYAHDEQLVINYNGTILRSQGRSFAGLMYRGADCVDSIVTASSSINENIRLEGFAVRGGFFRQGTGRYGLYAPRLNMGSAVLDMTFREGLGTVKIDEGYYSDIDIQVGPVVPNQTINGADDTEWNSVNGLQSAPLYLGAMNGATVKVRATTLAGEARVSDASPVQQAIWISGDSLGVPVLTVESTGIAFSSYTPALNYVLRPASQSVMTIRLYSESTKAAAGFIICDKHGKVRLEDVLCYNFDAPDFIVVTGFAQVHVDNYLIYAARVNRLQSVSGSIGAHPSVTWGDGIFIPGSRISGGDVFDTAGTSYLLGCTNGVGGVSDQVQLINYRREFPRVVSGLAVTASSDGSGAYIQVAGGSFKNEGRQIRTTYWKNGAGSGLAVIRLRPTTASKYYRVFMGEAGNPYLVQYDAAQTTEPEGDWLAEFATDVSTAITGLTANPRLSLRGIYKQGQNDGVEIVAAAVPAAGYFRKGSETVLTDANAGAAPRSRCVAAGSPGTWKDYGVLAS